MFGSGDVEGRMGMADAGMGRLVGTMSKRDRGFKGIWVVAHLVC